MSKSRVGNDSTEFLRGSGNVFADIGLPEAEEALAKARLAAAIVDALERRRLTPADAAAILGVDQPEVSLLMNGRLDELTLDRLVRHLITLGHDVEIVVRRPFRYGSEEQGRLSVTFG
ncbi:MAG TPA: helix-turn-helix transcriptional regulator, partial [Longimicrobiaceae bacterium]|nr:helix-turn-helix transcriptional regulator [Longimicrobiaceae bacterium]